MRQLKVAAVLRRHFARFQIKPGANLPEQICVICLEDLSHAYRFRLNCERSEAILQSFVDSSVDSADDIDGTEKVHDENETSSVVVASDEGALYEYWPPVGLNVKRVRTDSNKSLLAYSAKGNASRAKSIKLEPVQMLERIDETLSEDEPDADVGEPVEVSRKQPLRMMNRKIASADTDDPDYDPLQGNEAKVKPVRVNKARLGFSAGAKKVASAERLAKKKEATSPRRTSGEKKLPKTCPICGNTYKFQHALDSHMRRHRNEKPFVCSVCGKGFVINFELTRHMRTVSPARLARPLQPLTTAIGCPFSAHRPEAVRVQVLRAKVLRLRQPREARAHPHRRAAVRVRDLRQDVHLLARPVQPHAHPHRREEIPVSRRVPPHSAANINLLLSF